MAAMVGFDKIAHEGGQRRQRHAAATAGKFGMSAALASVDIAREATDIGAGAKRAIARPGHDDDAHGRVGLGLHDGFADFIAHLRRVGIHFGRPIERDGRDLVGRFIE